MNKHRTRALRPILRLLNSLPFLLLTILSMPPSITPFPPTVKADSPPAHLWVDANSGHDQNRGLDQSSALHTIQQAADQAGPGTTVHILPGVYRESIRPARDGSKAEPILYVSEGGPGTVAIRGSEPSLSLQWTQLSGNDIGLPSSVDPRKVYYTDLSSWNLADAPRFVVQLDGNGEVIRRLPVAREPDWHVVQDWKHAEFWWAADGGQSIPSCNPTIVDKCDNQTWSTTQLIDRTSDAEPVGIEAGNLTTLGNLSGATLVVLDTRQGHRSYRRVIASHDVSAGRVAVDEPCTYGSNGAALGWGSKYYVEGLPSLLDNPGEWWYDGHRKRLYIWPPENRNPSTQNIEMSRLDNGFVWNGLSNQILDGLTVEFYNEHAVYQYNNYRKRSYNNTIRNSILRYANWGIWVDQVVSASQPAENVTDGFGVLNSEIGHMDTRGMRFGSWWDDNARADSFVRSGIRNTVIRGNELHHLGFRSDEEFGYGMDFRYADRLRFEGNHIHHIAHHGVELLKSVIQSPKEYGFEPSEIKTGEILIADNIFERTCQLTTECAALNIYGRPPDNHVFRDVLITGNIFRDTFGWTYVAEKRGRWAGETSSDAGGMGGFGVDVDTASGIHFYRNIAYNNSHAGLRFAGTWRDGDIVYYNNVLANSIYGARFGGSGYDTHPSVNAQFVNNVLVNNEGYGILLHVQNAIDETMTIDHNLYYNNGWRSQADGGFYEPGNLIILRRSGNHSFYQTLAEVRSSTPWESHGVEGDPRFRAYDVLDHDLDDGSWPSFLLTSSSTNALNRGADLPGSLRALLDLFGMSDAPWGSAYDIGRYEWSGPLHDIYLPVIGRHTP